MMMYRLCRDIKEGRDLLKDQSLADNDQDDQVCMSQQHEGYGNGLSLHKERDYNVDIPAKPAIMMSVHTVRVMMLFHFFVGS